MYNPKLNGLLTGSRTLRFQKKISIFKFTKSVKSNSRDRIIDPGKAHIDFSRYYFAKNSLYAIPP